jgi:hypothetical protein
LRTIVELTRTYRKTVYYSQQGGNSGLQDFKTSKDFERLHDTSIARTSNFQKTSKNFKRLQRTAADFTRLQGTSRDFTRLHETLRDFKIS